MILDDIRRIIQENPNVKLAVFIRHAERNDGVGNMLTENGIGESEKIGFELKSLNCPIKIYTAPELRCVQTAEIINQRISEMENEIIITNKLSNLQIKNNNTYQKLYKEYNFIYKDLYDQWKNGKYYDALYSPKELLKRADSFIKATCTETGITLYISQSGTVAGIGYVYDLLDYDVPTGEWIDFLDGFVVKMENNE